MGQGIFKAIFGHFLNTYGTQMKIWTSKNILNTNIAQMNSKFNKIILFQNFMFLYLIFYKKSCKKYFFEVYKWFLCFYIHKTINSIMKIAQFIELHKKSIKSLLISRKNEFVP